MSGATRSFLLKRGAAMEEKRKPGKVADLVWDLAEPLVKDLGLILWDVKYVKEGVNRYLRIVIDKEGGVNITDCVAVNDALDIPLDELDPIPESYNLQVQSAGVERELTRDFHFGKYRGEKVILKLRSGFEGKKIWRCVLEDYKDGAVTVRFPDGEAHTFEKNAFVSVKADDFNDII